MKVQLCKVCGCVGQLGFHLPVYLGWEGIRRDDGDGWLIGSSSWALHPPRLVKEPCSEDG